MKKMVALVAVMGLNGLAVASSPADSNLDQVGRIVFEGGKTPKSLKNLRFMAERISPVQNRMPVLRAVNSVGPWFIGIEGHWVNSGKRLSPTIKVNGVEVAFKDSKFSLLWNVGEVLDVTFPPGEPRTINIPGRQSIGAHYVATPATLVPINLMQGVKVYTTLLVQFGKKIGKIVLPVSRLGIVH